jgi:DNA-directed RNA polymerase specialized sigma24 family protein
VSDQPNNPINPSIQALIRSFDILRRIPNFDGAEGEYEAFIKTIVEHRVLNILRDRRGPSRGQGRTSSLDAQPGIDSVLGRLDEDLVRADLMLDIQALVQRLPSELRRVAELLRFQSPTETARTLGVSRGTVYARLGEIRAICERTALREYLPTSSDSP